MASPYFPTDYLASRTRFQNQVHSMSCKKETGFWQVPSPTDADLQVDYAYFPATKQAENLLILISGVHGAESYTGSALQSLFIDEYLSKMALVNTGVLMVHALNPYGFKNNQRTTENLVNLNRNCSAFEKLFEIKNPGSLELCQKFIPQQPVKGLTSFLIQSQRHQDSKVFFSDISMDEFVKTVGPGQYQDPKALEFGGFKPEPQIHALTEYLKTLIPKYKNILLFDIHTGLGDRGALHLLTGDPKTCIHQGFFEEILKPTVDQKIYDYTSVETEGFYETFGATNDLVGELTRSDQRVCALTLEFGTLGHSLEKQLESMNQWMLEHQACNFGCESPELMKEIKKISLEKFNPRDEMWQEQVLKTAGNLFYRIFARLKII